MMVTLEVVHYLRKSIKPDLSGLPGQITIANKMKLIVHFGHVSMAASLIDEKETLNWFLKETDQGNVWDIDPEHEERTVSEIKYYFAMHNIKYKLED